MIHPRRQLEVLCGRSAPQHDFVHDFVNRVFVGDLRAKRAPSLANGALGVMTRATLAVGLIGRALA
jgi:hypothetical protein